MRWLGFREGFWVLGLERKGVRGRGAGKRRKSMFYVFTTG